MDVIRRENQVSWNLQNQLRRSALFHETCKTSWDIRHFFFARNGAQEPPSEDKKNNQNGQEQTRHQETTPWKITEKLKAQIELPGRQASKREMQIQVSGQKQEPQIKTQLVARSPNNSVNRELGDSLNLSENERPQNAGFLILEGQSSDPRDCVQKRRCCKPAGRYKPY